MAEQRTVNPTVVGSSPTPGARLNEGLNRSAFGYHEAMRFRLGFVSGFAAGYFLGAKAGRQRYEEIQRTLDKVRSTEAATRVRSVVDEQVDKAKAVVEESVDKAKTVVGEGVEKAKTVVDEGVDKVKAVADRGGPNTDSGPGPTNGTATVPTAAADPSAVPDGAGPSVVAPPADKPIT